MGGKSNRGRRVAGSRREGHKDFCEGALPTLVLA